MADKGQWQDINRAGSGTPPTSTDEPIKRDAQEAIDRADNASRLHREANRLADRSGK
jgi:hypothetical protein